MTANQEADAQAGKVLGSVNYNLSLTVIECGTCGITYGVPEGWRKEREQTHTPFSCPNGCRRVYLAKSQLDLAREETRMVQAKLNEAQHARLVKEREYDKLVRQHGQLERRVSNGTCPCCSRSFPNLAKHMQSKHPDQVIGEGNLKRLEEAEQPPPGD